MPVSNQILMHIVAAALVAAYLFGGPTPWVSKATAATVAIIQGVDFLVAWAMRPFERSLEARRLRKACTGDEPPISHAATEPSLALAAPPGPGSTAWRLAGGGGAILALARGLRLAGALTRPQHAVLPALALALGARLLLKALARSRVSEQEGTGRLEPEHVDGEFEWLRASSDPAGDPYHPSFWEDLPEWEPAEGPPSSEQISADVHLKCVLCL